MGEDLDELRDAFKREIVRERAQGHVIPEVRISITPSDFRGNPDGSGRITVSRSFTGVHVISHDLRVAGGDSLYRMPFKPGVVTAMDVLYSLQDAGELTLVGRQYFTRLAGKVMESFRVRAISFPGTGEAHASGRQGFVYTTGNGTFTRLVNDADRKQHVHADIHVIHAPDIALWRWIELGNPYYEDDDPTGTREMLADFDALTAGFRLQLPWPQPATGIVRVSVNVFDDAEYRVDACDINGRRVATLHEGRFGRTGVSSIAWDVTKIPAGTYLLRCSDGRSVGVQRLQVIH
jgi:hypothetical protein